MDHSGTPWPHFDRLHPAIFAESSGDGEILILDRSFGRNFKGVRHFEDRIRRSEIPIGGPGFLRRRIALLALFCPRLTPGGERLNFISGGRTGLPRRAPLPPPSRQSSAADPHAEFPS